MKISRAMSLTFALALGLWTPCSPEDTSGQCSEPPLPFGQFIGITQMTYAVSVDEVQPGSAAHKAGLRSGDLITGFTAGTGGRRRIEDFAPWTEFVRAMREAALGTDVTLDVLKYSQGNAPGTTRYDSSQVYLRLQFKHGVPQQPEIGISSTLALRVESIRPASLADQAGIVPGDFIVVVGGKLVGFLGPREIDCLVADLVSSRGMLKLKTVRDWRFLEESGRQVKKAQPRDMTIDLSSLPPNETETSDDR